MTTRRDLFDPTDPANLQTDQRLTEVASLLAAGVIRMREKRAAETPKLRSCRKSVGDTGSPRDRPAAPLTKISTESSENCLELSRGSCPDGPCG